MLFESLDVLRNVLKRVKKGDLSDIDANFVEDLKNSFETEYDITFIRPLNPEEITKLLNQNQNKSFKIYVRL